MEYRKPTRQPAREAAELDKELDAHIERSKQARIEEEDRSRRLSRALRTLHWALLPAALLVGGLGLWLDSSAMKLVALALLLFALFGAITRLLAAIPARKGGGGGDGYSGFR